TGIPRPGGGGQWGQPLSSALDVGIGFRNSTEVGNRPIESEPPAVREPSIHPSSGTRTVRGKHVGRFSEVAGRLRPPAAEAADPDLGRARGFGGVPRLPSAPGRLPLAGRNTRPPAARPHPGTGPPHPLSGTTSRQRRNPLSVRPHGPPCRRRGRSRGSPERV